MELSAAELFLIAVIVILAVLHIKLINRHTRMKFAGQKLSEALVAIADKKAIISRKADGEIQVEFTGESDGTGKQD